MSIRDWFIEPRVAPAHDPGGDVATRLAGPDRDPGGDVATRLAGPDRDPGGDVATRLAGPDRDPGGDVATRLASPARDSGADIATGPVPPAREPSAGVATRPAPPAREPASDAATPLVPLGREPATWAPPEPERFDDAPRSAARASGSHVSAAFTAFASEPPDAAPRPPRSAAVIGRRGDAEPVAAALALALRGATRAPAAVVVVIVEGGASPAVAGAATRGARRLAARLGAHGFEASARGRLAWVHVPDTAARRAAGIGAPAVVAVTVPLGSALEAVVSEQELAIVVAPGGDGPLARLAAASLARPGLVVRCVPPLPRGIARALARAGLRAPSGVRRLA